MLSVSSNRSSDLNLTNKTSKGLVGSPKDGSIRSNLQGIKSTKYKVEINNMQIKIAASPLSSSKINPFPSL